MPNHTDQTLRTPTDQPVWPQRDVQELLSGHAVNPAQGLSQVEATQRLAQYGPNALPSTTQRGPLKLLVEQFSDFMVLVLLGAAVVSGVIGDLTDTLAILVIVLLNAVIGFVQSWRADRALAALQQLAAAQANVLRDSQTHTVAAAALVPGDIVLLEAGNQVPADLRLFQVAQLQIDESVLTGESVTVAKQSAALPDNTSLALCDQLNMAFKGSTVTHGRARGLVMATGMVTELGKVAQLLDTETRSTPLQNRLAAFGKRLALVVIGICVVIFVAGIWRGEPPLLMAMTAISLAVAAIPEALPAVVTVLLALGARRMVTVHALIRRLPSVETLGSVTTICSDKTGTLTQNKMHAELLWANGQRWLPGKPVPGPVHQEALRAAALCNDAHPTAIRVNAVTCAAAPAVAEAKVAANLHQNYAAPMTAQVLSAHPHPGLPASTEEATTRCSDTTAASPPNWQGDPTETALVLAALAGGQDKAQLDADWPRLHEQPFDAERKRMTTLHASDKGFVSYTKGSPESVLACCTSQWSPSGTQPLDASVLIAQADALANQGLRVLALARRDHATLSAADQIDTLEHDLQFLGLIALIDPPRPEAAAAVRDCRSAGITPVMITGDHPATARAIAQRLGIVPDLQARVLTGQDLAKLDDAALQQQVADVRVYARVDPAQKIRIVQALQARGQIVAMTGDGVNDAPALKRADIGVAMGQGGTDVAREAASMVLLDDNFATIVAAVREGRRIFDNIRKFVRYAMTGNSGEIWTLFLAPLFFLPIPLLPIHILWVNLVTDGLPGLALAAEPAERGVMQRPPRAPDESLFGGGMWQHILLVGLLIGALCLGVQYWALSQHNPHGQTMVFTVLTLAQMAHVMAIRSERDALWTLGLGSNKPLLGAVLLTFALQMATIYVPPLNPIFKTQPLSLAELALCLAAAAVVGVVVEIEKAGHRASRPMSSLECP